MRALIAAADVRAAAGIAVILAKENFINDTTDLGEDGLQMAKAYDYDIILVDLMLPDIEGYKMLQRLRTARVHTPILILSCFVEPDQKVKFLRSGADDFLSKPFDDRELTARIEAIVRRSRGHSEPTIRTGRLAVNLATRVVAVDDQPVRLTPKEYCILEFLSLRKGTILTKEVFLDHLYGGRDEPDSKIIDVLICKLRKKLAQATGGNHYIETVWGHGYVLREQVAIPAATPVLSPKDLGVRHNQVGGRIAAECTAGQAYPAMPPRSTANRSDRASNHEFPQQQPDHPASRTRASRIGPDTKPMRISPPVEMRFEDAVTTDGGLSRVQQPLVRSLFGCATAKCSE
jgi:two-component system cell cycle response regulator CtrA